MPSVCILLAPGFEEIEAITVIDILRRAELDVVTVGLDANRVEGAHGITVEADRVISDASSTPWDLVVLPGGLPGATNLRDDARVQALLQEQHAAGRRLAAICAAPIALGKAGLLEGRAATCYPGFEDQLTGADLATDRVVESGRVTTSRGPGTAIEFALALVEQLCDGETASRLREGLLVGS